MSYINELNKLHMTILNNEKQEFIAFIVTLQMQLDSEYQNHAQSLKQETAHQKETERCLQHEQTTVQKLIEILNTIDLSSEVRVLNFIDLDILISEWESMKLKVKSLQNKLQYMINELQHKQAILENLSRSFEQSQSMSETTFSSDENTGTELAEAQTIFTLQEIRRQVEWEKAQMLFTISLLCSQRSFIWFELLQS